MHLGLCKKIENTGAGSSACLRTPSPLTFNLVVSSAVVLSPSLHCTFRLERNSTSAPRCSRVAVRSSFQSGTGNTAARAYVRARHACALNTSRQNTATRADPWHTSHARPPPPLSSASVSCASGLAAGRLLVFWSLASESALMVPA